MPNYLASNAEFTARSPFNEAQATELEALRPNWLMTVSTAISASIDARLIKRGDVPFASPYPELVKLWVADLLTPRAYLALGVRADDEQQQQIVAAAQRADDQITEAADPVKGLLVLPLTQAASTIQPDPLVTLAYSEQSPYTARHRQWDRVSQRRRYG